MGTLVGRAGPGRDVFRFRVSGWSMEPALMAGTEVLVATGVEERRLRIGDVLLCRAREDCFVLHRLVRWTRDGRPVTKGDRERRPDAPWHWSQITGVVIAARPHGGIWLEPRRHGWAVWRWALRFRRIPGFYSFSAILSTFLWTPAAGIGPITMPDSGESPRAMRNPKSGLVSQWLGAELAVYDAARREVHFLNRVAAWIWEWADEGQDAHAIAERLKGQFPEASEVQLREDTSRTIEKLTALGILTRDNLKQR